jgi:hypothetical protein
MAPEAQARQHIDHKLARAEQTDGLRLMKDHIASSCSMSRSDVDCAELADKGGLQ